MHFTNFWISAKLQTIVLLTLSSVGLTTAQSEEGFLRGVVVDASGAIIEGAEVTLSGSGVERKLVTDGQGRFESARLPAGSYSVRAAAAGFSASEKTGVRIAAGGTAAVDFELAILPTQDEITVADGLYRGRLTTESVFILSGRGLDALPDGPGGLMASLRIMAPFAGPQGPQVLINGFRGRRLPPKQVIRAVHFKGNAFSAENDELGVGSIEIFTKPGTKRFEGEGFFSFSNHSLNSRNPFSPERIPFQSAILSGSLSGPLVRDKATFFANFERHETDNNVLVNATVLNAELDPEPLALSIPRREARNVIHPRLDFLISPDHSLTGAYIGTIRSGDNEGVGAFSLPGRAYETSGSDHTLQLTENWIFGPTLLNQARFEYFRFGLRHEGSNFDPVVHVQGAFTAGGSELRNSRTTEDRWSLYDSLHWTRGNHQVRFGGEVRRAAVEDVDSSNLSGTFTFTGGLAPVLDEEGQPVVGPDGELELNPLTSLQRYRRTLLLQQLGVSGAKILELGGGPSQFSIVGGRLNSDVRQVEYGWFLQDDWKLRPNLTLSAGLRYEGQTNISSLDLAPRFALAWAPGASASQADTVIRAGAGLFYDRFSERHTLRSRRFNGANLREFTVSNPEILQMFPEIPSFELLEAFAVSPNRVVIADDLRTPQSFHASLSVERRLPGNLLLSTAFTRTRTANALRSRNINAPLPGIEGEIDLGGRPFPDLGPIFQIESSGVFRQNQLTVSLVNRSWKTMSWYATYRLSEAFSDTDGHDSFPADPFDLGSEYGRSSLVARHAFYMGNWINAPGETILTLMLVARSGLPFNIITGRDSNLDSLFTERPALAGDLSGPNVVITDFGVFDLDPPTGASIIPRNFGMGPGFLAVNFRLAKRFRFGSFLGGAGGDRSPGAAERRTHMVLSLDVDNLFNRVNLARPVGNLDSPFFGISVAPAGAFGFGNNFASNRMIRLGLYLRF